MRFESCHDCLRALRAGDGKSIFLELLRDNVRGADGAVWVFEGDGEREDLFGAERLMLESVGAEGDVKPLRICFPGAASCVCCCLCTALLTCPFRLGYLGFAVLVKSRNEWCAGCGCDRLRPLEGNAFGASKMMLLEELAGIGKEDGPPVASSRLISSKWERLPGPKKSEWVEEWQLLDLDDLEFVRSGGLPGGIPKAELASCAYVRVAMSGRGGRRVPIARNDVPVR